MELMKDHGSLEHSHLQREFFIHACLHAILKWCIKMYKHEEATLRTPFTWAFFPAFLPPLFISGIKHHEHSRDWGGGFIFWLHPLGWRHISWWEPQIWKLIEMLQLYDGDNFAGMFCPLSGQSDSGNMGGLWARVHLDVSALVASLRAPQRTSLWMRAAWRFCSFSKLYYALLMVSITPTQ